MEIRLAAKSYWLILLLMGGELHAQHKITYILTDPQGTPVAESDEQGNITARFDYMPYGVAWGNSGMSGAQVGPGYTGHVNDIDTGFIYMQQRYYDPMVGRFLSVDPVAPGPGNAFNFNRFVYTDDNPINHVDPDGRVVAVNNPGDGAKLAEWINSEAAGYFSFNSQGNLVQTRAAGVGDDSSKSNYYSDKLVQAINSPKTISLNIGTKAVTPDGRVTSIDVTARGGGVTLNDHNSGNQAVTVTGKGNEIQNLHDRNGRPLRDNAADTLMHELVGHAIPHVVGKDTGNAVKDENKVRAQIPGGGQRAYEPGHEE